jgi:hypothetical protein
MPADSSNSCDAGIIESTKLWISSEMKFLKDFYKNASIGIKYVIRKSDSIKYPVLRRKEG